MPTRMLDVDAVGEVRRPTVLFVGISTGGSRVFRQWSDFTGRLGLTGLHVAGVDIPAGAGDAVFDGLVEAIDANPHVRGAVVTNHKLRVYRAARDRLRRRELGVDLLGEVNTLRHAPEGLSGFARDVVAIDRVLDRASLRRPTIACLGSGGAARSLLLAAVLDVGASLRDDAPVLRTAADRPRLVFTDTEPAAVGEIGRVAAALGLPAGEVTGVDVPADDAGAANAAVLDGLPDGSLVVNATGLGKLDDASPLPTDHRWRPGTTAWDFNYRGPLPWLVAARVAGCATLDGAAYYEAGWLTALGAIAGRSAAESLLAAQLLR